MCVYIYIYMYMYIMVLWCSSASIRAARPPHMHRLAGVVYRRAGVMYSKGRIETSETKFESPAIGRIKPFCIYTRFNR